METKITIDYATTLPIIGNKPSVEIIGEENKVYTINFINSSNNQIIKTETIVGSGITSPGLPQYYIPWKIQVKLENKIIFEDIFNPAGKVVFVKIDAFALGDNIAWIPYVEEFRKKHNCVMICSSFFNHLFQNAYKNILFVAPNTEIKNVYAQYYIGANEENNPIYSPFNSKYIPLQKVASQILGLEHKEIRPELTWLENKDYKKPSDRKYVCISEKASHHKKEWKEINGWQKVVDFINSKGYDVVVISKEETDLKNVINKTGNIHLQNRIKDIAYAELFIGCSSGLSWLSWAIGTKTMIISDVTPSFHEPQEGVIRFNETNGKVVDYENFKTTSYTKVINELERVLK